MDANHVISLFKETGGLLEGHFLYASGRHGRHFLQAARVAQYPVHVEALCKALAQEFDASQVDAVCGPATGGIILAYETARHLDARAVFTEKDGSAGMALKRGFRMDPHTRVLIVEDVVTTGGSIQKTIDHLRSRHAEIVGVGVLVDRSGGQVRFNVPYRALAQLSLESWPPEECPLCKEGQPLIDPDDIVV
jgi:orotate phosphoribosyltransferase